MIDQAQYSKALTQLGVHLVDKIALLEAALKSDELNADWIPPSLCFCGRDRAECASDGSMCTDEFRPVEPAHVAADFEAGYGPYDRDED